MSTSNQQEEEITPESPKYIHVPVIRVIPQLSMVRVRSVIHFMTALCAIVVLGNLLELCTVLVSVCRPRYRAIIVIEGFAIMLSIACAVFARFRDSNLVGICNLDKKEWGLALIAAILHGIVASLVSSVRTGLGNISAVSFSWICLLLSTVVALLAFTTENGPGESFFFVERIPEVGQRVRDWIPEDNNEDGDVEGGVNNRNRNRRGDRDGVRNENGSRNQSGNQKRPSPSSETVIDVPDPSPSRPRPKPQTKSAIKNKRASATELCQRIDRVNASINVQVQDDDRESDIVEVGGERSQWRPSKRAQCVDFTPTHHQGGINLGSKGGGGGGRARGNQLEQGIPAEGSSSTREKKKEKRSGRNPVDGGDIKVDARAGGGSGLGARLAAIAAEKEAAVRRQGRPMQTALRQQDNDGDDSVRKSKINTGVPLLLSRNVPHEHEIVERL